MGHLLNQAANGRICAETEDQKGKGDQVDRGARRGDLARQKTV